MNLPEIFVARHGQTEWNVLGRMQGNLNSDLTPIGEDQARQLALILRSHVPEGADFISSPQPRAMRTARIALGLQMAAVVTDDRLREIDVGDWQGKSTEAIKAALPEHALKHILHYYDFAPNGEGFSGLRGRCTDFLTTLTCPTVIFTHGITSRMLRAIALGLSDSQLSDLPGGQGIVFHIRDGKQKILR